VLPAKGATPSTLELFGGILHIQTITTGEWINKFLHSYDEIGLSIERNASYKWKRWLNLRNSALKDTKRYNLYGSI
jgi:hypothetical protein